MSFALIGSNQCPIACSKSNESPLALRTIARGDQVAAPHRLTRVSTWFRLGEREPYRALRDTDI
jgi:hypothetical protein